MSKLSNKVTPLPKHGDVVRSIRDVNNLVARSKDYSATVIAKDGKKVKGLKVRVTPAGNKSWRVQIKAPAGHRKRNHTFTKPLAALSFAKAIEWAGTMYVEVVQGLHETGTDIEERAKREQEDEINTSIVELARRRADVKFKRGDLRQTAYKQDLVDIRHLEALIGELTFREFTPETAKSLDEAIKDDNTKLEKIPKLITKVFNSLSARNKRRPAYDPRDLLKIHVRRWKKKTRTDILLPDDQWGLFWSRLVRSDVDQVHKDLVLMYLLTGERRSAVLNARVEDINHKKKYLYMEAKGTDGEPSKNVVPITPYLGALLNRLQAGRTSGPLFPSRRIGKLGADNVKDSMHGVSRKLLADLGVYGDNEARLSAHPFRRTLANIVAMTTGSVATADEHVLHFTRYTSQAGPNYLDSNAEGFLKARRPSFERAHEYINELIVSQGRKAGADVYDWVKWEADGYPQTSPHIMIAQAIRFPAELGVDESDCGEVESERCAIVSFDRVDKDNVPINAKVTSPLAFMCHGGPVPALEVSQDKRQLIWDSLPTSIDWFRNNKAEIKQEWLGIGPDTELPDYLSEFK